MNNSNGMMAANTAQNPAAQQMLQQFMSGGAQAPLIKTNTAQDPVTVKKGQPKTLGNIVQNTADMHTLPFRGLGHLGDKKWQKAELRQNFGMDMISPQSETVVPPASQSIQNTAPQLDWASLLAQSQQQPQQM